MKEQDKLDRVLEWQRSAYVHPLTCGNNSSHSLLMPFLNEESKAALKCPECDYVQNYIPEVVLKADFKQLEIILKNKYGLE